MSLNLQPISILAILTLMLGVVGSYGFTKTERETIRQYTEKEYKNISKVLNDLKKTKHVWTESDSTFYGKWISGLKKEREGKHNDAVTKYQAAFKTPRYEISSYDVLLPLGRALLLSNKKTEAQRILKQYIKEAEGDISGETNPMWSISKEAAESLKKDIEFAKWLLKITER